MATQVGGAIQLSYDSSLVTWVYHVVQPAANHVTVYLSAAQLVLSMVLQAQVTNITTLQLLRRDTTVLPQLNI